MPHGAWGTLLRGKRFCFVMLCLSAGKNSGELAHNWCELLIGISDIAIIQHIQLIPIGCTHKLSAGE